MDSEGFSLETGHHAGSFGKLFISNPDPLKSTYAAINLPMWRLLENDL